METEHFDGTIKKQHGEVKDLLEEAEKELKRDDVKSVKIIKPMQKTRNTVLTKPKNMLPKKRNKKR